MNPKVPTFSTSGSSQTSPRTQYMVIHLGHFLYLNVVLQVLHQLFCDTFKFIWVSFLDFSETAKKLLLAAKHHKVNREKIIIS